MGEYVRPRTVKRLSVACSRKLLEHLQMHGGIAHDALFADLFPSGLELRLDEADGVRRPASAGPASAGRMSLSEINDTSTDCEIQLVGDLLVREIARRSCAPWHTTRSSLRSLQCELTVADVHGVDLLRAVLQHTVGEAAGRRADVGADTVRERDRPKRRHRLFELEPAAADVAQRVAAHLDAPRRRRPACRPYRPFARSHRHMPLIMLALAPWRAVSARPRATSSDVQVVPLSLIGRPSCAVRARQSPRPVRIALVQLADAPLLG